MAEAARVTIYSCFLVNLLMVISDPTIQMRPRLTGLNCGSHWTLSAGHSLASGKGSSDISIGASFQCRGKELWGSLYFRGSDIWVQTMFLLSS